MEELAKKIVNYLRRKMSPQALEFYAKEKKTVLYPISTFRELTDKQVGHLTRIIELFLKGENTLVYDFGRPSGENNYFDIFPTVYKLVCVPFYYEDEDYLRTFSVAVLMSGETIWQYTFNSDFIDLIFRIKDKLNKNTK